MIASAPSVDVWDVLNRNLFFVKNAVKRLEAKTGDKYDIYDPNLRELVMECREPDLGGVTKFRRLAGGHYDAGAPFNLVTTIPQNGRQVFRVTREIPFLSLNRPGVEVYDHQDLQTATLKAKFISLSRKFVFTTPQKTLLFELQVKEGLNRYHLLLNRKAVAGISRKWKRSQADYFGEGFDYALCLANDVPPNDGTRLLLIAFVIAAHRILN